jgi:hypothetical protein
VTAERPRLDPDVIRRSFMSSDIPPAFGAAMNVHTADLSDAFFVLLRDACKRLECDPLDMLGVMMNESGVHANAKNPSADANGLIQFMGETLRGEGGQPGLGWKGSSEAFRQLTAEQQVPWVERYYAPHKGQLVSAGACYLATFLPAFMKHANDTTFVLCGANGPLSWAYNANRSFDHDKKGFINIQDLTVAVERACVGPRWVEVAMRMHDALDADTPLPPAT